MPYSQDKVTAVANPVATAALSLVTALGTALEMFPKGEAEPIVKQLEGKTPKEAAQVLRQEAIKAQEPAHEEALNHAADKLEEIQPVDIGPRSKRISTGTGVETPAETEMIQKWKADISKEITPDSPIGIKNDAIDEQLEEMGLPPATPGEKITFQGALDDAAKKMDEDPQAGQKLVDELKTNPRPITGNEDALLLREQNRLRIERDNAEKALTDAKDDTERAEARLRVAKARDDFQAASEVATKVGTANAQGLALRQMMMKEDYSLAALEQRMLKANEGKPLSEEQQTQIKELHKQLTETQKAFDDYKASKQKLPREKPTGSVSKYLSARADEAWLRIKARLAEGRVQSGIDPTDIADHVIIGADYVARGLTAFGDWSEAMVKEFGEKIRPLLKPIFEKAKEEHKEASRLAAFKTWTKGATEKLEAKLASGDLEQADPESPSRWMRKGHEAEGQSGARAKESSARRNAGPPAQLHSGYESGDAFLKWVRVGALSYPTVLAKLTGAAIARGISTPLEQVVGYGASKLLPELAGKAPSEGVPSFSGMVRAESKAVTEGLTKGMQGASWDMPLHNRDTDEQVLLEKTHLPPEAIDFLGKVHGALKYPTQIADYSRRLQLRTEYAIRQGIDPTNPIQQMRLMHEAWMDSKRSIFLQDNGVVNAYKSAISTLEAKQKSTGEKSAALQLISTGLQTELPIVKVPTNVIAEVSEVLTGSLTGSAKAAFAYAKGIENLKPEQADAIMRLMKKGSIGLALTALGYFKAKQIGGYYQRGEKRKQSDVKADEMRVGDTDVPSQLLHNPYFEAMQFGATLNRASGALVKKNGGNPKGPLLGLVGASIGLFDQVPFIRETSTLDKYADSRQALNAADQK